MKKIFLIMLLMIAFLCISSASAYENQTSIENNVNQSDGLVSNYPDSRPTPTNEIKFHDMNNPDQNPQNKNPPTNEIKFHDMNNPNQNNIRYDLKFTYFSNVLTNIQKETAFKIILKTPHVDSNNNIIDTDGVPLSNKTVIMSINGVDYTRKTNADGIARLNINLNPGKYNITYQFLGDSQYNPSKSEIEINVFNGNTFMLYLEDEIYRTEQFKVALFDANETRLSNKNIIINVNGINYTRTTNSDGIAKLNIKLDPGQYPIYYSFMGSGNYQACFGNTLIHVSMKNIILNPINFNIKKGTKFMVKFTDEYGNPVRNQVVYFNINNVAYNRTTNSNGIGSLNIKLPSGQYTANVGFYTTPVNMYNTVMPKSYTINVFDENNNQYHITSLSNYIIKGTAYQVKLTDENNNALSNKKITFCINSVQYTKQTNSNGIAKINIHLNYNNYIISVSYGTSTSQSSIHEMITVTSGNMNMLYTPNNYLENYYIISNTSYQCLDNTHIQTLSNTITNGTSNNLEKAVLIHNYVYRLNYKYNING